MMRHIQTVCAVKETIASGDDCPLKHQCYHFRSRGFLPRVPRAFHPPPCRVEDGFPRIVELRCASPNRLLLQSRKKKKKKKKARLLVTGTMRNDWLCGRLQAQHRNLVRIIPWQLPEREERRAESAAGFSGRLSSSLLRRFFKHCILELAKSLWGGYCVCPVTQCNRISHFQVEWMQRFIHRRDGDLSFGGTHSWPVFLNFMEPLDIFLVFMSQLLRHMNGKKHLWMSAVQLSMCRAAAN